MISDKVKLRPGDIIQDKNNNKKFIITDILYNYISYRMDHDDCVYVTSNKYIYNTNSISIKHKPYIKKQCKNI